jgi:hypothetical protein
MTSEKWSWNTTSIRKRAYVSTLQAHGCTYYHGRIHDSPGYAQLYAFGRSAEAPGYEQYATGRDCGDWDGSEIELFTDGS